MSFHRSPDPAAPPAISVEDYAKATRNIPEDFAGEKAELEATQRAVVNILEDFTAEKAHLEEAQRAALNILEDFTADRAWFEDAQRAMLNILDDFGQERVRVEAANRDLSEAFESLRQAKEAVEAANRELDAFAYSVAHDLRAPLRAMDGFSMALLEDCREKLDGDASEYLMRIRAASQRMAQLIDDLLQLSRVTRGEMRRSTVDLSGAARAIAQELRESQPTRRAEFIIEDDLVAEGDVSLLQQVLRNLLENAWKFTAKHPAARIEFGATERDGVRAFFVRDDGAGFDMAYADKLFGVFQRLHSAGDFQGTGIGLATVQRIVHRHGGRVWAEGAPERGATFYFALAQAPRARVVQQGREDRC